MLLYVSLRHLKSLIVCIDIPAVVHTRTCTIDSLPLQNTCAPVSILQVQIHMHHVNLEFCPCSLHPNPKRSYLVVMPHSCQQRDAVV